MEKFVAKYGRICIKTRGSSKNMEEFVAYLGVVFQSMEEFVERFGVLFKSMEEFVYEKGVLFLKKG